MRYLASAALAVLLASAGAAVAQSPPPPMMIAPATNWSGLYVGGNMGGVWNDHAVNFGGTGLAPAARAAGVIPTQLSESPAGFLGGLQLGYNFNWGPVLLGVETDAQYSGLNDSSSHTATTSSGPFVTPTTTAQQSMDFFGTLRGRVGFTPFGSTLIYGTGGLAYGHVGVSSSVESTPCTAGFCNSRNTDDVHVGWTGGGGIEMAVAPQLSLKVEYLYYDLGTINQSYSDFAGRFGGTSVTTHTAFNGNVLRLGVNYHFGAPPPPPPAPAAMPAPPPAAAKVFIVFFDWDRDTITPEGQQIIQQAADAYESGSPVQLQVTGYTDRSGSPGYNQRLSERRANNVARALAALGVPKEQMSVSGRGENDNRVPTADGVREPQNRRVEIVSP